MKAIVYERYGSSDVLHLQEVDKPTPKDHEVLVKVKAASVNSWDWDLMTGKPLVYRLLFGLFSPRHKIIGSDIAGVVEAVGKNVKTLQPGDEVFGDISGEGFGAFAEYACASAEILARKPKNMSFEDAAALPQAGVLALQGLRAHGKILPGQKILINGAGGGVGTLGIQLANLYGAEVSAVDSGEKLEMLQKLGAADLIDYRKEDFTASGQTYDLILDVILKQPLAHCRRALRPEGAYVVIGGDIGRIAQIMLMGGKKQGKKLKVLMHQPNRQDLEALAVLYTDGKLKPVIDKTYPLSEAGEAVSYLGKGHAQGKVVLSV